MCVCSLGNTITGVLQCQSHHATQTVFIFDEQDIGHKRSGYDPVGVYPHHSSLVARVSSHENFGHWGNHPSTEFRGVVRLLVFIPKGFNLIAVGERCATPTDSIDTDRDPEGVTVLPQFDP